MYLNYFILNSAGFCDDAFFGHSLPGMSWFNFGCEQPELYQTHVFLIKPFKSLFAFSLGFLLALKSMIPEKFPSERAVCGCSWQWAETWSCPLPDADGPSPNHRAQQSLSGELGVPL